MTRGKILHLTRAQVVQRGLSQLAALVAAPNGTPHPIGYRLEGGFNGGFDPEAAHCASFSYGERVPTADCIGFVLWASGIDRLQPGFAGVNGDWLNCTSLVADAAGAKKFCRPLVAGETPKPGDWLLNKDHIGLVIRGQWHDYIHEKDGMPVLVVDCSPRHDQTRAAAIGIGGAWSDTCRVVRPTFYADV